MRHFSRPPRYQELQEAFSGHYTRQGQMGNSRSATAGQVVRMNLT